MDVLNNSVFVSSADGTRIHCRQSGHGPGLVLVHGGLETARVFDKLAADLSRDFTVFAVDRRGRRPSGAAGRNDGLQKEVEDLSAVLEETGATCLFGLSSGALVCMKTALQATAISRLALYEPPLALTGVRPTPIRIVPRVENALDRGDLAQAFAVLLQDADDPSWFTSLPRFILVPLLRLMLAMQKPGAAAPSVAELIPTARLDIAAVREMAGSLEQCRRLSMPVLLLGGTKSQRYLALALEALHAVLPRASRVTFKGLGHLAATDDGAPDRVAAALRAFFLEGTP